jgi:hypothetical protein
VRKVSDHSKTLVQGAALVSVATGVVPLLSLLSLAYVSAYFHSINADVAEIIEALTNGDLLKALIWWVPTWSLAFASLAAFLLTGKLKGIRRWAVIFGVVLFGWLLTLGLPDVGVGSRLFYSFSPIKVSLVTVGLIASLALVARAGAGRLNLITVVFLTGVAALSAAAGQGFEDARWTNGYAAIRNIDPEAPPCLERGIETGQIVRFKNQVRVERPSHERAERCAR